ncbi:MULTISPECIES: hypothetical protein [unclassified Streptomyces]|uniref:hypothetical protein n=1 Tax=unclassified Streptomyces TaxID=2593676 RepID=UPI000CD52C1B|nr:MULTISPECIES: hypothetical protein [unclassified Streptomyces]
MARRLLLLLPLTAFTAACGVSGAEPEVSRPDRPAWLALPSPGEPDRPAERVTERVTGRTSVAMGPVLPPTAWIASPEPQESLTPVREDPSVTRLPVTAPSGPQMAPPSPGPTAAPHAAPAPRTVPQRTPENPENPETALRPSDLCEAAHDHLDPQLREVCTSLFGR